MFLSQSGTNAILYIRGVNVKYNVCIQHAWKLKHSPRVLYTDARGTFDFQPYTRRLFYGTTLGRTYVYILYIHVRRVYMSASEYVYECT